jgi:hypothetical protein
MMPRHTYRHGWTFHRKEEILKVEYKEGKKGTYRVEYSKSFCAMTNKDCPYGLSFGYNNPDALVSSRTKPKYSGKSVFDIFRDELGPYLKEIPEKYNHCALELYYLLDGTLLYMVVRFNNSIHIPVDVFEKLEHAIKTEHKVVFQYDPERIKAYKFDYILLASWFDFNVLKSRWEKTKKITKLQVINRS